MDRDDPAIGRIEYRDRYRDRRVRQHGLAQRGGQPSISGTPVNGTPVSILKGPVLSYKQQTLEDRWDAIVIGSGIGGLAAAALLSKHAGKKVLVLERHYTAGGYTHSFRRPGYAWDVGVHYVGETLDPASPVRATFDHLTDGKLAWQPMPEVYDRAVIAGRTFDFPAGPENLRAALKQAFPGEASAIDGYLGAVRAVQKAARLYFVEKAIPRPIARLAGGFMRAGFLKWASQTTLDVLRRFTKNQDLIGVLTAQWGDYGLPPAQSSFGMHAIIAQHYFEGAGYPVGGAAANCRNHRAVDRA